MACGLVGPLHAAPPTVGVRVPLPLTGTRDTQVEAAILRQLDTLGGQPDTRGVLVLSFTPLEGEDAAASDFGRAVALARFLTDERLAGVKTVAFLPEGAAGHAVLVALACEEIVMPADVSLGPANAAERAVDEAMRAAYLQVAGRRRTVPPALALALLDPAARVVRASTGEGERVVEERELDALRAATAVLDVEPLGPAPLVLSGRRGRELGVVRLLAETSDELARGLGLPERDVQAGPDAAGWQAAQVVISGGITGETVARTRQRIERAVSGGATLVILRIDSDGGAPDQSLVLASWLAGLDPGRVRTVAYVTREARGDAALVALACDELVLHPAAVLGGEGAASIGERQGESIVAAWRAGVAERRRRSWSLPVALVVPGITVLRVDDAASGTVAYLCEQELDARGDRAAVDVGRPIGIGPIAVDGRRAEELGLATHVVDDFTGLRAAYGLGADVELVEPGWAGKLLDALASPSLAWLLLLIGGAGLYVELKTPGLGLGGFVAMVAFIVYFWSQYLHGTSGWLEVMLFLAGLVCLLAEIFVLPGFGILGLGGGLLVVVSIVLASQSFVLPVNDYQIRQMQWSLAGILAAACGVVALGFLLRRWLPSAPLLRHVVLEPPPASDAADDTGHLAALVGAAGTTTSRLAPAGKAWIEGAMYDVVSDGPLIEPGTAVRVVAVRDGRIVVRQV